MTKASDKKVSDDKASDETKGDPSDPTGDTPTTKIVDGALTVADGAGSSVLDSDPGIKTAEGADGEGVTTEDVADLLAGNDGNAESFEPTDAESIDFDKVMGVTNAAGHMAAKLQAPDIGALPPTVPVSAVPAQNAALHSGAFGQAFTTRDAADEKWAKKQQAIASGQTDVVRDDEQSTPVAVHDPDAARAEKERLRDEGVLDDDFKVIKKG